METYTYGVIQTIQNKNSTLKTITKIKKTFSSALGSGGKCTQLSYLSKSKDTLVENYWSKSEIPPVKYYLSKSLKVFGLKCS